MVSVIYNDALKTDYETLFDTCIIRPDKLSSVQRSLQKIQLGKPRYMSLQNVTKVPWILIGLIHLLECGCDFSKHLHNGDPLTGRTVHVPKGRLPLPSLPPFSFVESALDALKLRHLLTVVDWSIPRLLFLLESYNGLGYRQYHPSVNSPYLWAGTNHYTSGKYVADGKFSPTAVSLQIGCAAILKLAVQDDLYHPVT